MPDQNKTRFQTSEFWMTVITSMLAVFVILAKTDKAVAWASAAAALLMAGVYAYFQTNLPSESPGWRTKTFWASIITIVGSIAVTLSETSIPGLPAAVSQIAAMVASAIAAGGYTIYRHQSKIATQAKTQNLPPKP